MSSLDGAALGPPTPAAGVATPTGTEDRDAALRAHAGAPTSGAGPRVAVVDYGMGNRRSVEKALRHVGAEAVVTAEPAAIEGADGLVLCGVGAFPAGAERLAATGLGELVRARVDAGVPLLGICLGMQLLFDGSDEHGGSRGLGLLPGTVRRLDPGPGLKTPHIGWNVVTWRSGAALAAGTESGAFYHVHSYVAEPADDADVVAHGDYGRPFVTAVERDRVLGVQFHPEKSSTEGLRVLATFVATCARSAA